MTNLSIYHSAHAESRISSPTSFPAVPNLRYLNLSSWTGSRERSPYSWPSLVQLLTDCKNLVSFDASFACLTGLTDTSFSTPTILRLEEFEYFGYHPFLPFFFRTFSLPILKRLTIDIFPDVEDPDDTGYDSEDETFSVPSVEYMKIDGRRGYRLLEALVDYRAEQLTLEPCHIDHLTRRLSISPQKFILSWRGCFIDLTLREAGNMLDLSETRVLHIAIDDELSWLASRYKFDFLLPAPSLSSLVVVGSRDSDPSSMNTLLNYIYAPLLRDVRYQKVAQING